MSCSKACVLDFWRVTAEEPSNASTSARKQPRRWRGAVKLSNLIYGGWRVWGGGREKGWGRRGNMSGHWSVTS